MTSIPTTYDGQPMTTPLALERLTAIRAFVEGAVMASQAQIAEAIGVNRRTAGRYVGHLCEIGHLNQLVSPGFGEPALYELGDAGDDVPLAPSAPLAPEFIQRTVGPDDWQRGEHAHRSDLLAAFYPFAQG